MLSANISILCSMTATFSSCSSMPPVPSTWLIHAVSWGSTTLKMRSRAMPCTSKHIVHISSTLASTISLNKQSTKQTCTRRICDNVAHTCVYYLTNLRDENSFLTQEQKKTLKCLSCIHIESLTLPQTVSWPGSATPRSYQRQNSCQWSHTLVAARSRSRTQWVATRNDTHIYNRLQEEPHSSKLTIYYWNKRYIIKGGSNLYYKKSHVSPSVRHTVQ